MKVKNPKYIPYREWYFDGYTRQQNLDGSAGRWVYYGDYYKYNTDRLPKYKLQIGALFLLSVLCVIGILVYPGAVSRGWTGFVNLLLVVPLLFLLVSTVYFVGQKPPLTVRQIHAGYYEMSKWVTWDFMLLCINLVCMIVFLVMEAGNIAVVKEIWPVVFLAVHIGANRVWLMLLNRNYPVKTV